MKAVGSILSVVLLISTCLAVPPDPRCPPSSELSSICDFDPARGDCILDADCINGKICCSGGCGKRCVDPQQSFAAEKAIGKRAKRAKRAKRETSCTSQNDCKPSYCCVNKQTDATSGVCQKMGSSRTVCYMRDPYTAVAPTGIVQTCPCGFGNFCSPLHGQSDPAFGEMGFCNSFK